MRSNNDIRQRDAAEHGKGCNITALFPRERVQSTPEQARKAAAEPPPDNDPGPSAA